MDGISFLVLAMGTFAMTEAVYMAAKAKSQIERGLFFGLRSLALGRATTSTMAPAVGRGSILGFFVGTLPGAGATMASFLAYGLEKTFPKPSETAMGRGNTRGLAAPEAANNAACTGSFVPLLTLGIPGSGTTAILLGAHCLRDPTWTTALYRNAKSVLVCRDLHVYRQLNTSFSQSTADSLHCSHTHHSQITPRTTYSDVLGRRRLFSLL